jgi:cytochrome P450
VRWVFDPVRYMQDCTQTDPDCFATSISGSGSDRVIFVQQPRILQYLFAHDRRELFAPGDGIAVLEPLIGNTSVVTLEGEAHQRRRRLLLPPFHGERLHIYGDLIAQITRHESARLPSTRLFGPTASPSRSRCRSSCKACLVSDEESGLKKFANC